MLQDQLLEQGTRVRLVAPNWLLTLRSDLGTVVRKAESADYYIVQLDQPAIYRTFDGQTEDLDEIAESADNLEILPAGM